MDFRESVKQHAIDLGFDLVGIAPAAPAGDLDFVEEWLQRGFGGEMGYLSNPERLDPTLVLPSIRSVICVGLIYDTPFPYSTEVGSGLMAGGGKQESGVSIEGLDRSGSNTAGSEPQSVDFQPSPSGRGWSREAGTGEGESPEVRFPTSDAPVSNFQFPISQAPEPRAWIARYAWGRDYHEIMREKLEMLRSSILELAPGLETRVYVDTGPVPERAFARWSGIGWMGKNTCIINEGKGSWFFLGVILTSLALEPDLPAPDRCGSCTACIDACPTGALVDPYVMDASRCISYLTIELKGSIPSDLRSGMGANVFGCDICQDVCPWNGKGRSQNSGVGSQKVDFEPMTVTAGAPNQNPPSASEFSLFNPSLEALAAMTEDDFRRAFRHSPIRRAKYRGWLRNLCVAMGNSGDPRQVPRLKELASHPDALVREHAEWAIEQVRRSKTTTATQAALDV